MSGIDWGGVLKGVAGEIGKQAPTILSQALQNAGGLPGIANKLQQAGLDKQVASWLSNGKNMPVTKDQLRAALNDKELQQIARSLGVPVDQALDVLAKYLPDAVDQASPTGQLPKK
ncbi:MAG TPA: YidB family protein [Xanthobacteraceae bacterium]|nr:YidB family protein [Xanthobacteraceae bacterium]